MDMGRPVARHHVRRPHEDPDAQAAAAAPTGDVDRAAPAAAEQAPAPAHG